ncbi:MAG: TolC family protein [Candidatus Omnitrophica bacterium]|nr:TolC family protein [Candidatus Omnitrophota bacterium]MBU1905890.1 TolC family protein [Candidatus Omnitrophota bacterium]
MNKALKRNIFIFIIIFTGIVNSAYSQEKTIELSLEDVTNLALENSLDIQIAKFDAYIQRTSLKKQESVFDTFLKAEIGYRRDKREQATTILGEEEKEHYYSVGVEKKLPTGTTLSLDATGRKNRSDSTFAAFNPYNEAETGISITQELGKNFFGLADRADIKITKLDIENSDYTSLDEIEESIFSVQKAYWNFVLKDIRLSINEEMLDQAHKLYKIYKDKYEIGLVEESELLAMEALMSARLSEVFIAELEKDNAKNDLLFLINHGEFEQRIRAKDTLDSSTKPADIYEELKEAIKHRRDYIRKTNELKINNIEVVVKKNSLWPQIDLEATFTRNNLDSDRGSAWSGLSDNSNDEASFALSFKMPLENREAKAELESKKLENQKLLLELKRTERNILRELHNQVNQVNTMQNQVELFQATVKIHENKLEKQIERLNYGRSDADTLIRYEEDLLGARLSLATYLYQYKISQIELTLAKNSLLDEYWKEPL